MRPIRRQAAVQHVGRALGRPSTSASSHRPCPGQRRRHPARIAPSPARGRSGLRSARKAREGGVAVVFGVISSPRNSTPRGTHEHARHRRCQVRPQPRCETRRAAVGNVGTHASPSPPRAPHPQHRQQPPQRHHQPPLDHHSRRWNRGSAARSSSTLSRNATRRAIVECCHDCKKPGRSRLMPLTSATFSSAG